MIVRQPCCFDDSMAGRLTFVELRAVFESFPVSTFYIQDLIDLGFEIPIWKLNACFECSDWCELQKCD
jgi:hypothetical protein